MTDEVRFPVQMVLPNDEVEVPWGDVPSLPLEVIADTEPDADSTIWIAGDEWSYATEKLDPSHWSNHVQIHDSSWVPEETNVAPGPVRMFDSGAVRDTENGKYDYEGFFSPAVLRRRARYMHKHRVQKDGTLRDADNWQKGFPLDVYMASAFRHFIDWWSANRETLLLEDEIEALEDSICALMFNCEGYLFELNKLSNRK